jgi:hypothetical protein
MTVIRCDHRTETATMATDKQTTPVWLTLHEAATTLGISTRTLQRRIADGQVVAQGEGRQRRVCVEIPDTSTAAGSGLHASTVSAIVGRLDDTARETRQLAAAIAVGGERWQAEAVTAIRSARRGWAVAGAASIAAAVGTTGWLMSSSDAELKRLELKAMQARVDAAADDARQARQDARAALARPWWMSGTGGTIKAAAARSGDPRASDTRPETDKPDSDPQQASGSALEPDKPTR